jgi:hypothetical protein
VYDKQDNALLLQTLSAEGCGQLPHFLPPNYNWNRNRQCTYNVTFPRYSTSLTTFHSKSFCGYLTSPAKKKNVLCTSCKVLTCKKLNFLTDFHRSNLYQILHKPFRWYIRIHEGRDRKTQERTNDWTERGTGRLRSWCYFSLTEPFWGDLMPPAATKRTKVYTQSAR